MTCTTDLQSTKEQVQKATAADRLMGFGLSPRNAAFRVDFSTGVLEISYLFHFIF